MDMYRHELHQIVEKWQKDSDRNSTSQFAYKDLLDDLLYHADMRYKDYKQFQEDGPFIYRLKKWIDNFDDENDKKYGFQLLQWLIFIDDKQVQSLYRDAYRSKVVPWITYRTFKIHDFLAPDYQHKLIKLLRNYKLCSITESFNLPFFKQINSLVGLPKMEVIGENRNIIRQKVKMWTKEKINGLIIFEDIVGTGKQALRVLREVIENCPKSWDNLFIPLIVLTDGASRMVNAKMKQIHIDPVLIIPATCCLKNLPETDEPTEFKGIRSIVKKYTSRVNESLHPYDDAPLDPFGYENSGSVIVTSHNTPNNTLPLIHHRAPDWLPLFRRVHHKKG
jgi:hypothetical protein